MKYFLKLGSIAFAASLLANCGSHSALPFSQTNGNHRMSSAHASPPIDEFADGIPDVFAAARNKDLTDADLDTYIDKSITGTDRALAHKFMRMMPKSMRGDFVYVDENDHLVTNNPRLLPYIRVTHSKINAVTAERTTDSTVGSRRVMGGYQSACAPPNPPSQPKGPYTRQVSQCGFTTGWTFLHLTCGSTTLYSNDSGYMYMELRGNGIGLPSPSLNEGGLFVPYDPANQGDHHINPYVRTYNGYQTLQNSGARYDCLYDLGIVSGATQDGRYIYTATGELPSYCQPETSFCNGNQFSFVQQAWLFANAPPDITGGGFDAAHVPTPCGNCSISRVTTIAQNNVTTYTENGDLFASDPFGNAYLHYMQTAFGEWESNCQPGTSLCTFEADPVSWTLSDLRRRSPRWPRKSSPTLRSSDIRSWNWSALAAA